MEAHTNLSPELNAAPREFNPAADQLKDFSTRSTIKFDIADVAGVDSPYAIYDYFRRTDPVHRGAPKPGSTRDACYYLFRSVDCAAALSNDQFRKNAADSPSKPSASTNSFSSMLANWMLLKDPPEHTRLRSLLGTAFGKAEISKLTFSLRQTADKLSREFLSSGASDLVESYANDLPLFTIARFLGLPDSDHEFLKRSCAALTKPFESRCPFANTSAANEPIEQLQNYLTSHLEESRKSPNGGFMSTLAGRKGEFTRDELSSTAALLLFGGHQSAAHLITSTLKCVLEQPQVAKELKRDPKLFEAAALEALRYESPVQITYRQAGVDIHAFGQTIEKGADVGIMLGSANRDPEVFVNPHNFMLDRPASRSLAFGHGRHFCPGNHLAILQAAIATQTLLTSIPDAKLSSYAWAQTSTFRGLEHLKVSY